MLQENKDLEDGVKITPFNLREEQEEGTFTKDGNFVWKKEKEIVDSWLDNVDWVKVKEMSAEETRQKDLKVSSLAHRLVFSPLRRFKHNIFFVNSRICGGTQCISCLNIKIQQFLRILEAINMKFSFKLNFYCLRP